MSADCNAISVTVVSADTELRKELAWTLSVFGYRTTASHDWGDDAVWRQPTAPSIQLLDLRGADQDSAATDGAGSAYRIAMVDSSSVGECLPPVDDVIQLPLSTGELLTRVRTAVRRLEFERRRKLNAFTHSELGLLSRRGMLTSMERRAQGAAPGGSLVLLAIDDFEINRRGRGEQAAHDLNTALCRLAQKTFGASVRPAMLHPGCVAVAMPGCPTEQAHSLAQAAVEAYKRNEPLAKAARFRPTLSAVVASWASDDEPAGLLSRTEEALQLSLYQGGGNVSLVREIEAEAAAWRSKVDDGALFQNVRAQHVMTPFPMAIPAADTAARIADLRALDAPRLAGLGCLPVLNEAGRATAVVDLGLLTDSQPGSRPTNNELVTDNFHTIPHSAVLSEVLDAFSEHDAETLIVVQKEQAIGYIGCSALTELFTSAIDGSAYHHNPDPEIGLAGLAVPMLLAPVEAE